MKKLFTLLSFFAFAAMAQAQAPIDTLQGDVTANRTITKNKVWILKGFVYVKNGATLTIEAGTVIKGDKASKGTLIVTRGARVNAQGSVNAPIVFTSNSTVGNRAIGDWGGIIILGRAATNTSRDLGGGNAVKGEGSVEGGVNNANGDGIYGGTPVVNDDSSGVFSYVRIEFAGIPFQANNEINGLTLAGVGSKTKIDHVQVSHCGDDSFEFFGGSVNATHLIAFGGTDDDFDCDLGYTGKVQFALSLRQFDGQGLPYSA